MLAPTLQVLTPRAVVSWLPENDDGDGDLSWLLPLADDLDASSSSSSASPSSSAASSSAVFDAASESTSDTPSSPSSSRSCKRAAGHRSSGSRKASTRSASMPTLANSLSRTKHEIGTLREQVAELESVLRRLKKIASRARPYAPSPIGCDEALDGPEMRDMAVLWKGAARHQRDLVKRALRENQKLRLNVLDQRGLARILHKMLLERSLEGAILSEKLLFPPPSSGDADLSAADRAVMANLIAELASMHLAPEAPYTDRVMSVPDGGSFHDMQVRHDAANGVATLESIACEEVPFGKAAVDRAIYSGLGASTPGHRRYDPRLFGGAPTFGVIEELSRIVTPVGPESYRQRRSVRTCSRDERQSVSVSLGLIEPVDANGQPAPGLTFRAKMWIVRAQKTRVNEATGAEEVSTVLQNFSTISLASVRGPYSLQWGQQVFEGVVSPLLRRAGLARLQKLENALLSRETLR